MSVKDRAFYALQAGLPTLALTGLAHRLAQSRIPWLKQTLIDQAQAAFSIDMEEAEDSDKTAYPSFNAFFTRGLKPGARPLAPEPAVISPVDGTISQLGNIQDGRIFQAKGRDYSVAELLDDPSQAERFAAGSFMTIYLAPSDYHRIHSPINAEVTAARYIAGRLFSVNPATVRAATRLFARNERLVSYMKSPDSSDMALVMVGALFVSGIETVFLGNVTPPHGGNSRALPLQEPVKMQRGDEFGRFNYGSTVILLSASRIRWEKALAAGTPLRMGQSIGQVVD